MIKQWLGELRPALIITRREVRDQFRDWRIIFPIIILTLFFPALMNFTAKRAVAFVEQYGAPVVGDRLIPFLLMVVGFFPISVSLVIALESFAGEKERRSLEPLLASPLNDWQLYFGKLLAAMVVPLLASYLGITVYLIGVYTQVGWTPSIELLSQIVLLTTVQALVMVCGAVVISTQTTSVRAANLLASFIIIPMAILIQGESIVMFWARYYILWWTVAGLVVIAGLLIRSGVVHFSREGLLGRELDTPNIRWAGRVFAATFIGEACNPWQWYRGVLQLTRREMLVPIVCMVLALTIGIIVGATQANTFSIPPEVLNWESLDQGFVQGFEALSFLSVSGVIGVWLHNLRAILLASIFGLFSFGVLGIIILILPLMLVGYFMANFAVAGLSPWMFLAAFVLPHGILEIPAMVLAGAAILRLGASLASPAHNRTIGESVIQASAKWARIIIGLVLPILLGAALLEVYLTPRLALWLLGS